MRKRATGDDILFTEKPKKAIPHAFVLDRLARVEPETRPMFGCLAVYVGEKIVMALRDKPAPAEDNGVWLATSPEHHESLRAELPSLRSIGVLGTGVTGWQMIASDDEAFEEQVLAACAMVLADDPRIGKVPKPRRPRAGSEVGMGRGDGGARATTKAAKGAKATASATKKKSAAKR